MKWNVVIASVMESECDYKYQVLVPSIGRLSRFNVETRAGLWLSEKTGGIGDPQKSFTAQ